jgi:oxalate decarboxylase/phosphoglucose isomerase-like protein (cupin superfamily)
MDRKAFIATGAVAAVGAAAASAESAAAALSHEAKAEHEYLFDLLGSKPQSFSGGTARVITKSDFPALEGISFAYVTIKPGAIRVPHWHSGNEINFNIKGKTRVGIVDGKKLDQFIVGEGSASFIPGGWLHFIENASDTEEARLFLAFSQAANQSFGLGATMKTLPASALAQGSGSRRPRRRRSRRISRCCAPKPGPGRPRQPAALAARPRRRGS